jgi:hypothetical protein
MAPPPHEQLRRLANHYRRPLFIRDPGGVRCGQTPAVQARFALNQEE